MIYYIIIQDCKLELNHRVGGTFGTRIELQKPNTDNDVDNENDDEDDNVDNDNDDNDDYNDDDENDIWPRSPSRYK